MLPSRKILFPGIIILGLFLSLVFTANPEWSQFLQDGQAKVISPITSEAQPQKNQKKSLPDGTILINEIKYGGNNKNLSKNERWVEFVNISNKKINLKGWTLTDKNLTKLVTFSSLVMEPGAFLTVYAQPGQNKIKKSKSNYSLVKTTLALSQTDDAIALFNSDVMATKNLVDFVAYCQNTCSTSSKAQTMAEEAGKWAINDQVFHLFSPEEGPAIGRTYKYWDSNSASDWFYEGKIAITKTDSYSTDVATTTPGAINSNGIEQFDTVGPFDFPITDGNVKKTASSSGNKTTPAPKLYASLNSGKILIAENKDCDNLALVKEALNMIQKSCIDTEYLSTSIKNINTSTLKAGSYYGPLMGTSQTVTTIDLGNIELKLGAAGAKYRGEAEFDYANDKARRHAQPKDKNKIPNPAPDSIDQNITIHINLAKVNCDAEKMKGILLHELVHEKQMRSTGLGYWNEGGTRTQPVSKNSSFGTNAKDPRIMTLDCMEAEAHLVTARCLQKEKQMPEYQKYSKSIDELIVDSKLFADKFMFNGTGNDPNRKGCIPYIKGLKNNLDPLSSNSKIKSPDWIKDNEKILDSYMNNWVKRLKDLSSILYEKYFLPPPDGSKTYDGKVKEGIEKFKKFIRDTFGTSPEEAQKYIDKWNEFQKKEKENPDKTGSAPLVPKLSGTTSGQTRPPTTPPPVKSPTKITKPATKITTPLTTPTYSF